MESFFQTANSPFSRFLIGFDPLIREIERQAKRIGSYPPYNIVKTGEESIMIELAVAGFRPDEIEVKTEGDVLFVIGKVAESAERPEMLHNGLGRRSFEHNFMLGQHMKVTGASLQDGLLKIDVVREVPEAAKPRVVPIKAA
jgi:molecular chaperone IbpA